MKLVVNRCFGGAGLSPQGVKTAVENGVPLEHWPFNQENDLGYKPNPTPTEDLGGGFFLYGKGLLGSIVKDGQSYSQHLSSKIELRSHPGLIKTVESLGTAANSRFSDLEVVEIPDGIEVTIEEYDGAEHVAEVHRTW